MKKLLKDKEYQKVMAVFIILKIIIIAIGALAIFPQSQTWRAEITGNRVIDSFLQYDSLAYLDIAENGYNSNYHNGIGNYGFYPLFPFLIRMFSFIGYGLSAFLISNILSFIAVTLLYILFREESKKAIMYFLLFPTAYFLTAAYTESLFITLTIGVFLAAKREKWFYVGILGFLAAMTRIQGVFLIIPVLYMYYKKHLSKISINNLIKAAKSTKLNVLFLLMIPAGFAVFMLYLYSVTGDITIHFKNHLMYGRYFSMPWVGIINALAMLPSGLFSFIYNGFNLFILIFFAILLWFCWKFYRIHEYTIYFLISFLIPLFTPTLQAFSRFMLPVFPAFIVMTKLSEKYDYALKIIYILFTIALFAFTVWHVNGGFKIPGFN